MSMIVATDFHAGRDSVGYAREEEEVNTHGSQATQLLQKLVTQSGEANLVVVLGDLINEEDRETDRAMIEEIMKILRQQYPEQIVIPGNHDTRNLSGEQLAQLGLITDISIIKKNKKTFLTIVPDAHTEAPYMSDEILQRIERLIRLQKDPHIYLLSHWPFVTTQVIQDNYYFQGEGYEKYAVRTNGQALYALLQRKFPDKKFTVLHGHTHFMDLSEQGNIITHCVPSLTEDRAGQPQSAFVHIMPENGTCIKRLHERGTTERR